MENENDQEQSHETQGPQIVEMPSPTEPELQIIPEFAAALDMENQTAESLTPDPLPDDDPIGFLIDRVQNVVAESAQMGSEPLTTKAGVLAALYQAQSLDMIADCAQQIAQGLEDLLSHLKSITGEHAISKDGEDNTRLA